MEHDDDMPPMEDGDAIMTEEQRVMSAWMWDRLERTEFPAWRYRAPLPSVAPDGDLLTF